MSTTHSASVFVSLAYWLICLFIFSHQLDASQAPLPQLSGRRLQARDSNTVEQFNKRSPSGNFQGYQVVDFYDFQSILEDEAETIAKFKQDTRTWIKGGKRYMDSLWVLDSCAPNYSKDVQDLMVEWGAEESLYTPHREWIDTPPDCARHTDGETLLQVTIGVLGVTRLGYIFLLDFEEGKLFVRDLNGVGTLGRWSYAAVTAWIINAPLAKPMFEATGRPFKGDLVGVVDLTPLEQTERAQSLFADYASVLQKPLGDWHTLSAADQDLITLGFMGSGVRRGFSNICFGYPEDLGRKIISQMQIWVEGGTNDAPTYSVEMMLKNHPTYNTPFTPPKASGPVLPAVPTKPASMRAGPIRPSATS